MPAPRLSPVDRLRGTGRTSDRVFTELSEAIRDLRLLPGEALSETDLAEQLQVSRTPVREAVARLVDAGLVQVVPQVGTRVARIAMSDAQEARFVRETLEVAVFEEACALPVRDVSVLREILGKQEAAHADGDLAEWFRLDEALHIEIFRIGGHPGAWQAVQRVKLQLDRVRRLSLPDPSTTRDLIDEHRLIVDALADGRTPDGCAAVRAHARRVLEQAPKLLAQHPDYFTE
ncbi:GntR family transcriptional regulator [Streptomyces sp. NBC_00154]|uniref:GntR family transcriptional regulator n=1 Tax=Streptomyces sp. NBC_00154 TaxID=2975670 RepID=UPI002252AECB|nr:GntR family transcriptional regulator [Streptomyces sp. NBC_00154]MCX5317015.1 GntR family transcriptional regulator [Streptomyces sp. NBC_00154]